MGHKFENFTVTTNDYRYILFVLQQTEYICGHLCDYRYILFVLQQTEYICGHLWWP
jgi:hypothetical protein